MSVTATVDPTIATVLHLSWTTPTAVAQSVSFGEGDVYDRVVTEASASTTHAVSLTGLHADTDVHYQVDAAGSSEDRGDAVARTGALPRDLHTFEVVSPMTNANLGPYVVTSLLTYVDETSTVLVVDASGAVVWYWRVTGGIDSVRPTRDGTGVVFVVDHSADRTQNTLDRVWFDGRATETPAPWAHHDVAEVSDGLWVVPVSTFLTIDSENVAGDQFVEIDADGFGRVIWDAFDALTVVRNNGWTSGIIPGAEDWTHTNGLAYDPVADTIVASLYFPEEVVKVERATGATDWVLGGTDNTFTFPNGAQFGPQHAPELTASGLRLFDNYDMSGSRVVELALDESALTATQTWSWGPTTPLWTPILGDVHRYDDGSALSAWGLTGDVLAVDGAGGSAGEWLAGAGDVVGQVSDLAAFR